MGIATAEQISEDVRLRLKPDKWFNFLGYKTHPGEQLLFDRMMNPQYRFFVWVCGRRWGKSLTASKWADLNFLLQDTYGWVVSKTYDLTMKVIREILIDVEKKYMEPRGMKFEIRQASGPIKFVAPWGATLEGKSVDHPESLLGEGLDWLIIDEAAKLPERIWDYFLRATLTDKLGKVLFITTPNGYNWIYDLYKRGLDDNFPEWTSYRGPSWENPHLPKVDIDEARRTMSQAAFAQEYGADFTTYTGQVYKEFDEAVHVIPDSELRIDPGWPRYRSIDFGYENPFACLYIAVDSEDRVIIYDEYVQRHVTIEKHAAELNRREDGKETKYEFTTADPSGASARATLLENGIPTLAQRSNVQQGLEAVRQQLLTRADNKPGLYVSSKCVNTIKEFNLYSYPSKVNPDTEAPAKDNDHEMDAIRYFIVNWRRGYISQRIGRYA